MVLGFGWFDDRCRVLYGEHGLVNYLIGCKDGYFSQNLPDSAFIDVFRNCLVKACSLYTCTVLAFVS